MIHCEIETYENYGKMATCKNVISLTIVMSVSMLRFVDPVTTNTKNNRR
jgi:hypothetical protein